MEIVEPIDPHYKQGFNEGYLVTKHWPDMSDSIAEVRGSLPRLDGFRDGKRQFVLEQTKDHRPKWLQSRQDHTGTKGHSKDKDIEHDRK